MIARTAPAITAAALLVLVIATAFLAPRREAAPAGQMTGVLYSLDRDTQAARAAAAEMPELNVGLDPAARAALPPAQALVVRFVAIEDSTFTLTLARRFFDIEAARRSEPAKKPIARLPAAGKRRSRRTKAALRAVAAAAAPLVPATTAAVSTPATAPLPAAAAPPAPTFPPTFAEIDDALRASSTVQAINVRVKKAGVTFRLTHVGRVGDRYVVRYAIANEEAADFFLSIVNISAEGKAIHSEAAGPYSCPAGREVFGVVHFMPVAVAGKKIVVELVQSGGEHRRFALSVDYAF